MHDTSFIVPPAKFSRLVTGSRRQPDGTWTPNERKQPAVPTSYGGGGGLYSTAPDYTRFTQAMLKRGAGLVQPETFELLATNQNGDIRAGAMKTTNPAVSADVDIHPGETGHHTLGCVINPAPHKDGRAGGSLAWPASTRSSGSIPSAIGAR